MKKILFSICTVVAISSCAMAGGDMKNVEPAVEPVVAVPEVSHNGFYLGLGLSAVSTRDASVSMDFFDGKVGQDRLGELLLIGGYDFNEYIGVEGRYMTSIVDEDSVEMDGWSLFVKPQYPVTENFTVYALLGFGGVNIDGVKSSIADVDDTDFQWGVGASYTFMDDFSVFVDYTSLASDMDGRYSNGATSVDADAINVGVNYKF